jgi:hypothetical protein
VARAVGLLLETQGVAGEAYNCYDRYVSEYDVAMIAQRLLGSPSEIRGRQTSPKHQIETGKLRALGLEFGGEALLEKTVAELVAAARA